MFKKSPLEEPQSANPPDLKAMLEDIQRTWIEKAKSMADLGPEHFIGFVTKLLEYLQAWLAEHVRMREYALVNYEKLRQEFEGTDPNSHIGG
jgi:hypothetical protein